MSRLVDQRWPKPHRWPGPTLDSNRLTERIASLATSIRRLVAKPYTVDKHVKRTFAGKIATNGESVLGPVIKRTSGGEHSGDRRQRFYERRYLPVDRHYLYCCTKFCESFVKPVLYTSSWACQFSKRIRDAASPWCRIGILYSVVLVVALDSH